MDTQKDKATPTPWALWNSPDKSQRFMIYGKGRIPVCIIETDDKENLHLIVKAVNEYDKLKADNSALLEACREANKYLAKEASLGKCLTMEEWSKTQSTLSQAINQATK